jgi:uncharacterized protein YggU (UPF0235/DUF167 family)
MVPPRAPSFRSSEIRGEPTPAKPASAAELNQALVELVADALGVGRDRVRIVGGHTSRRKLVEVDGLEVDEVGRRLEAAAPSSR